MKCIEQGYKKTKPAFSQNILLLSLTALCLALAISLCSFSPPLNAQQQPAETEDPAKAERTILRFLTSNDFPPFNYYDEEGNLSGFHIDLANAICREMVVRCDIRVRNWNEIPLAFKGGDFDAIIAGTAVSKENFKTMDFSNSYMRMPGRFAILKSRPQPEPDPKRMSGKKVGVIETSAHQAYLKKFFSEAKLVTFKSQSQATSALQRGEVDYLFGDAIQIMFWLNGSLSKQCCKFHGDAYWDAKYFGEGLAIAINKGDMKLRIELNEAINQIRSSGTFEELMLRYFPINIY